MSTVFSTCCSGPHPHPWDEGRINRPLTEAECPWLKAAITEGAVVYRYRQPGGPAITPGCVAVTDEEIESMSRARVPVYQVPEDSVTWGKRDPGIYG